MKFGLCPACALVVEEGDWDGFDALGNTDPAETEAAKQALREWLAKVGEPVRTCRVTWQGFALCAACGVGQDLDLPIEEFEVRS